MHINDIISQRVAMVAIGALDQENVAKLEHGACCTNNDVPLMYVVKVDSEFLWESDTLWRRHMP